MNDHGISRFLPSSTSAMLVAALVGAVGCGPSIPAPPSTQPVHGNVTLEGEPVTRGFVRFVPAAGSSGRFAEGMIAEDGSYSVSAFKGQAGTLPGDYQVYFSSIQRAAEGESEGDPLAIPKKYLRPETSELKVTVTSGDNDIPLELHADEGGEAEATTETTE
ncbi:MAG TPA: hypothetical protein VHC22_18135 [Pirellulales bacterium]|nr:hypothetical protein [Pirellulales bacterium]